MGGLSKKLEVPKDKMKKMATKKPSTLRSRATINSIDSIPISRKKTIRKMDTLEEKSDDAIGPDDIINEEFDDENETIVRGKSSLRQFEDSPSQRRSTQRVSIRDKTPSSDKFDSDI